MRIKWLYMAEALSSLSILKFDVKRAPDRTSLFFWETLFLAQRDLASCASTKSFSIWTDFYWTINFHCTQFTCLIELKCTIWELIRLKILADLSGNLNTIQWGYIWTLIRNNVKWLVKSFISDGAGCCGECQTIDFCILTIWYGTEVRPSVLFSKWLDSYLILSNTALSKLSRIYR